MKALSLWAPWGSLVMDGRKKIETRHWSAPNWLIGQPLAIHQTKYVDVGMCTRCGYSAKTIPRGAMLGVVRLDKCEQFTREFYDQVMLLPEGDYGDFEPGRFGWFFTVLEKFETPFPCRGHQTLFGWEKP